MRAAYVNGIGDQAVSRAERELLVIEAERVHDRDGQFMQVELVLYHVEAEVVRLCCCQRGDHAPDQVRPAALGSTRTTHARQPFCAESFVRPQSW